MRNRKTVYTYQPGWSVKRNQFRSWTCWWKEPIRLDDGSVGYRTHGKVIADEGLTAEEAAKRAKRFMARIRVPHMEDAAVEKLRKDTAIILARQKKENAVKHKKPEPVGIKSIVFDPPGSYLLESSGSILSEYLISRLSKAANLRKAIAEMQATAISYEAEAMLGRWMLNNRQALIDAARKTGPRPAMELPEGITNSKTRDAIDELTQRLLGQGTRRT